MKRRTIFVIASIVLIGGPLCVAQRLNRVSTSSPVTTEPNFQNGESVQYSSAPDSSAPASTTGTKNAAESVLAPASPPNSAMARIVETHEKVVNYAVATPVYETHTKKVKYTVMVPVTETHVRQVPYTVMRVVTSEHAPPANSENADRIIRTVAHVPETKVKSVAYTVTKMVPEERTKIVAYKTCRIVTETKQKTVQYTTTRFVPAAALQRELERQSENAVDPMGVNRCLN